MGSKKAPLFAAICLAACAAAAVAASAAIYLRVLGHAEGFIDGDPAKAPRAHTALVLGARVYGDGRPSHILHDRLETGLALYRLGRVKKILLSGDHGTRAYDEVNRMKDFLIGRGVPPSDVFLDHAGFNTYDSLSRARDVFGADDIIVVTQRYHLPRALWIAHGLGLRARGVPADRRTYLMMRYYRFREVPATLKTWVDLARRRPPHHGGPPIPIRGDGRRSWD